MDTTNKMYHKLIERPEKLAKSGHLSKALVLIKAIADERYKKEAILHLIVLVLLENHKFDQSIEILEKIKPYFTDKEILGELIQDATFCIILALAANNQLDRALIMTNAIVEISHKNNALSNLAISLSDNGQKDQALAVADKISDPLLKTSTLKTIHYN